ncbi:MAG: hypothetical protein ACRC2T_10980 [Thermoguttaceae bacterium]
MCNVGSQNYRDGLENEEDWKKFVAAVKSAREIGLRIWIYDEDGYPSPEAGGLVLKNNPELECLALVFDENESDKEKRFFVRPAYEFTHAANNFAAARRYPNLLDEKATQKFIEITHEKYRNKLGPELFSQIEAFFTDEPSSNAVNIGELPESVKSQVRIDDPLDPNIKPLPMVPWCNDFEEIFNARFDKEPGTRTEFSSHLEKLFGKENQPQSSDDSADSADTPTSPPALAQGNSVVRAATPEEIEYSQSWRNGLFKQRFWFLVSELEAERYYGQIQDWCKKAGSSVPTLDDPNKPLRLASSGHTLHEEPIVAHVPLDGNKLKVLRRLDLPGLDMLNSDPRAVFWGAWKAVIFPASAAALENRRLVMSEVSDFSQIMAGEGDVSLEKMCAASSWQAALGVTEFTLYFGIKKRTNAAGTDLTAEETHKKYSEFIGRLNSVLRKAVPVRNVVLEYPICELANEYIPFADPIDLKKQSARTQELIAQFENKADQLLKKQIPFIVSDSSPDISELANKHFVYTTDEVPGAALSEEVFWYLPKISPSSDWIVLGQFERDDKMIFLLLNTDEKPYIGNLLLPTGEQIRMTPSTQNDEIQKTLKNKRNWSVLDPATGEIKEIKVDKITETIPQRAQAINDVLESIPVELSPNQTLIFVGDKF